jgi:GTP-binding protein EngB required for normal cell division
MLSRLFGSKNPKDKNVEFMKGSSILSQLDKSNYGKIKKMMVNCFDDEFNKKYTLPIILVCGDENVGKSSLLENITKCPIFPRNNTFCTRCPTHIKMEYNSFEQYYVEFDGEKTIIQNKESISSIVETYMNNLQQNVSNKKIIVGIQGPQVPTLELYDLPGIVAHPKETSKQISKIYKTYLREKNVIPICVVPVNISSLSTSKSIAIIKEENLEEQSILVFTKIDQVDINIGFNLKQIFQRLLIDCKKYGFEAAEDTKNLKFSKIVGIINRTHDDSKTLEENEEYEKKWFNSNLIEKYKNEEPELINELSYNLGIQNLLSGIDKYYSKFINENWKPYIEKQIIKDIKNLKNEMSIIGIEYNKLDDIEYNNIIFNIECSLKENYRESYICSGDYYSEIESERENNNIENITDYKECDLYYKLNNIVNELKIDEKFIKVLENNINKYFDNDNEYILGRYSILKKSIIEYIIKKINEYFNYNKSRIVNTLNLRIDNYYIDCEFRDYKRFYSIVNKMIRGLVFEPVYHNWDFKIDKNIHFIENEELCELRKTYEQKNVVLKYNLEKIKDIVI